MISESYKEWTNLYTEEVGEIWNKGKDDLRKARMILFVLRRIQEDLEKQLEEFEIKYSAIKQQKQLKMSLSTITKNQDQTRPIYDQTTVNFIDKIENQLPTVNESSDDTICSSPKISRQKYYKRRKSVYSSRDDIFSKKSLFNRDANIPNIDKKTLIPNLSNSSSNASTPKLSQSADDLIDCTVIDSTPDISKISKKSHSRVDCSWKKNKLKSNSGNATLTQMFLIASESSTKENKGGQVVSNEIERKNSASKTWEENTVNIANDTFCENDAFKQPKEIVCKEQVVRGKNRQKLEGWDCEECREFYGGLNLNTQEVKNLQNKCSKHRATRKPDDYTPPGYWTLAFSPTQKTIRDETQQQCSEDMAVDRVLNICLLASLVSIYSTIAIPSQITDNKLHNEPSNLRKLVNALFNPFEISTQPDVIEFKQQLSNTNNPFEPKAIYKRNIEEEKGGRRKKKHQTRRKGKEKKERRNIEKNKNEDNQNCTCAVDHERGIADSLLKVIIDSLKRQDIDNIYDTNERNYDNPTMRFINLLPIIIPGIIKVIPKLIKKRKLSDIEQENQNCTCAVSDQERTVKDLVEFLMNSLQRQAVNNERNYDNPTMRFTNFLPIVFDVIPKLFPKKWKLSDIKQDYERGIADDLLAVIFHFLKRQDINNVYDTNERIYDPLMRGDFWKIVGSVVESLIPFAKETPMKKRKLSDIKYRNSLPKRDKGKHPSNSKLYGRTSMDEGDVVESVTQLEGFERNEISDTTNDDDEELQDGIVENNDEDENGEQMDESVDFSLLSDGDNKLKGVEEDLLGGSGSESGLPMDDDEDFSTILDESPKKPSIEPTHEDSGTLPYLYQPTKDLMGEMNRNSRPQTLDIPDYVGLPLQEVRPMGQMPGQMKLKIKKKRNDPEFPQHKYERPLNDIADEFNQNDIGFQYLPDRKEGSHLLTRPSYPQNSKGDMDSWNHSLSKRRQRKPKMLKKRGKFPGYLLGNPQDYMSGRPNRFLLTKNRKPNIGKEWIEASNLADTFYPNRGPSQQPDIF